MLSRHLEFRVHDHVSSFPFPMLFTSRVLREMRNYALFENS